HFITAAHFTGPQLGTFDLHGDLYTTIGFQDIPGTDLRVWEVNHAKPFATWAPLSSGAADIGAVATVFGRGRPRGGEVFVGLEAKGWFWGNHDRVKRWGRNVIDGVYDGGEDYGELIYAEFNQPGIAHECHLSGGDSGGGVFVLEDGLWRLAGINLSVDGPFRKSASDPVFSATLYDMGGLEVRVDETNWEPVIEEEEVIPESLYSSRIAASLGWLVANVPGTTALAPESFAAWRIWYFSPAQIANETIAGPAADPDKDGIANLMEYALNLDPLFAEPFAMSPGTGLRGLPAVRVENSSGNDRLTIEFVRRAAGSGSDIIYTPHFSNGLGAWQPGGDETVTPINTRWERVKVVDTENVGDHPRRFARLMVQPDDG
ncbi:MAG TPA: hypothetical protein VLO11_10890, partial [Luteolibacter sp.]|nr:hypothetical protein [Luteolibacter sp.]